ncbi:MAG: hypothetical protein A2Y91_00815 [Chloroflexi bacterium RBG_13_54_8]|nr:MAG: hypothetical protein A2Y91_00815 [Chloroflexi bacterium RBG_13_54_8]
MTELNLRAKITAREAIKASHGRRLCDMLQTLTGLVHKDQGLCSDRAPPLVLCVGKAATGTPSR